MQYLLIKKRAEFIIDQVYLFPIFDTGSLLEGVNKQLDKSTIIMLGFTAVAVEGFKEVYNNVGSWSNRVLNTDNNVQFEPTPNGDINQEIKEVFAGKGSARIDERTGLPKECENRDNTKKTKNLGRIN